MHAIVFDLDGTLIDSAPDLHSAANKLLAEEGRPPLSLAQITSFIGNGVVKLVERVLRESGLAPDHDGRMTERFLAHYGAAPTALTRCYPGVRALLENLVRDGYALGVCTNKPIAPTRAILKDMDLARYFKAVTGGDSLPARKPDPTMLHHTLTRLNAGRGLYVGDSEIDAETAQRAGVDFALFTEGYRKAPVADLPHLFSFAEFSALEGIVAAHFDQSARA